jgi:hypothetical protein
VRTILNLVFCLVFSLVPMLVGAQMVPPSPPPPTKYQQIQFDGLVYLYLDKTNRTGDKYQAERPLLQIRDIDEPGKKFIEVQVLEMDRCRETGTVKCAVAYTNYYMDYDTLIKTGGNVFGVSTGILAVPFKFHTDDHATTAGATIGGYLGWEMYRSKSDISWIPIIAGGLALVPQKQAAIAAKADTPASEGSTLTGVSAAVGILGRAKSNFQFGLLVGWDWVGKSQGYKYEGKPWISFAIGYDFSAK